jgi:hypothetical protein
MLCVGTLRFAHPTVSVERVTHPYMVIARLDRAIQ